VLSVSVISPKNCPGCAAVTRLSTLGYPYCAVLVML